MLITKTLTRLSRPLLAVTLIAASSTLSFGAPPPRSVSGPWLTTTSVAYPRYTEDYRFAEASEEKLISLCLTSPEDERKIADWVYLAQALYRAKRRILHVHWPGAGNDRRDRRGIDKLPASQGRGIDLSG